MDSKKFTDTKITAACILLLTRNFVGLWKLYLTNCDCLSKNRPFHTKTEFNFIATIYRHTQYLSIPSVPRVKC